MQSRYGELLVAVRDGEERVRFLGYDPANIKLVAYIAAALFASIAGALFAPIVGIITPAQVGVVPSIAFLIGVAIGGRTTLLGPGAGRHRRGLGANRCSPNGFRRHGPTSRACCSSSSSASSPAASPVSGALFAHRRRRAKDAAPNPNR